MSNKLSKYFISNKSQSGNIRCNFTILIKKNELSDFINKDDYMQLSCDSLNDEEVEMNISKSFKNKDEFERYLNNNKTLIKNFIVDES